MSWYFVERGERVGPIGEEELALHVRAGRVGAETLVWSDGMAAWQPLRAVRPDVVPAESAACTECRRPLPADELVPYGAHRVCAACKPLLLQRLREGHLVAGAFVYGNFWPRFGAKLLDGILLWVVNTGIQLAVFGSMTMGAELQGESPDMGAFWRRYFLSLFLSLGMNGAYHIGMNGRWGATLGKRALGLKIVRPDGSPIGYGKATARFFAEWLSSLTLLVGYIMASFDDERRTLHDRICDTRVIKV